MVLCQHSSLLGEHAENHVSSEERDRIYHYAVKENSDNSKLTLDQLLSGITQTQGFSSVKRHCPLLLQIQNQTPNYERTNLLRQNQSPGTPIGLYRIFERRFSMAYGREAKSSSRNSRFLSRQQRQNYQRRLGE